MPAVKSSFQSGSRLESSPSSSYYGVVTNFHLGLFVFVAVVSARYVVLKLLHGRQQQRSSPAPIYYYSAKLSADRDFIWTTEKSRGVSMISGGSRMSSGRADVPSSSVKSDNEGSSSGHEPGEKVDLAAAGTSEELGRTVASSAGERTSMSLLSRPPPPPPLTLPELSSTVFTFGDRRSSLPPPALPGLDTEAFIHQPNPDYTGESSSTAVENTTPAPAEVPILSTASRRRSYTKIVSAGTHAEGTEHEFAPSSFPSTSPHLPPPAEFPETSHAQHDIDIQGEIISAFDGAGHGWKRHTRVYGGGVCLACLQSGGEGGFYGENVRPEDRR